MTMPKAYAPIEGQKYQLLIRSGSEREWEHLDYAEDKKEKDFMVAEYTLAFHNGAEMKVILLPKKFWKKESSQSAINRRD